MEEFSLVDESVACYLTQPEDGALRRVVLGVHGLGGSAMDTIQRSLAEEMCLFSAATVRFDFPGHGRSPRDRFDLPGCIHALMTAARFARDRFPQVEDLCIFATGFGAYITLLCLDELTALPGKLRLVVQTPSVLMHETLLSMLHITEPTFRAMDSCTLPLPRPLVISYDFYRDMRENPAIIPQVLPFLILQGEEDDFIPIQDIRQLRRLNENSRLVIIPGASHRFLEEGAWDMVLDLTRDWFEFQQVLVTDWE